MPRHPRSSQLLLSELVSKNDKTCSCQYLCDATPARGLWQKFAMLVSVCTRRGECIYILTVSNMNQSGSITTYVFVIWQIVKNTK